MTKEPSPETTLVVILGASEFPDAPKLTPKEAFRHSAEGLRDYLFNDEDGFGLPRKNLLNLFNSPDTQSQIDRQVGEFLERQAKDVKASDVLIYYVGHGSFSRDGSEYFLALRKTRSDQPYFSSYPIKALANTLKEHARHLRKYLILDSCFAASAYADFQATGPLEVARLKTEERFPGKGTALLCASGPRNPAKAPEEKEYTMFSGALLDVIRQGSPNDSNERLSLATIGELTSARIKELYPDDAVRPEVLSPEQRHGDVAAIPLFPNAAMRSVARIGSLGTILPESQLSAARIKPKTENASDKW